MKFFRYINLFVLFWILYLPMYSEIILPQDSPVSSITSVIKEKLYAEIEKYSQQRNKELQKLRQMRTGIERLLIQKSVPPEERELRSKKLKRIQLFLLNEISLLQSEKRILLNRNDALKSLKIRYEVAAVINDADRKIFDQYSQFILIKVNMINQSIRAREALFNRIYVTLDNEKSGINWQRFFGPGVGIILFVLISWRFFQM
ncbi:hypothetical protein JW964_08810 [candidate division KSB1 bacterium]|nr:hypothetical protein [candidate division KSB1 bacterium]